MGLAGKVAIVTGGGSGIGAAIAHKLLSEGANVMIAARRDNTLVDVAESSGAGDRIAWKVTDVADEDQVAALVEATVERFGRLDLLVNNAGTGGLARVTETATEDWMRVFAVDLHSAFFLCRAGIPHLIKAGGGAILNIASVSGMNGDKGFGAYNSAKAGLINFTRTLAMEYVDQNIRANVISPGLIRTPSGETIPDHNLKQFFASIPMSRWGEADEIADAAVFLLSDKASYITGTNLVVDGGIHASTHFPSFLDMLDEGWTGTLIAKKAD